MIEPGEGIAHFDETPTAPPIGAIQDLQESTPEAQDVQKAQEPLSPEEKEQRLAELSARAFFQADRALRKTTMSRGGVIRSLRAAMHEDLTDIQLKLISQEEKNLAVILYEMLTARTIMQAQVIKKQQKGEKNEQSSNEEISSISESEVV